MFRKERSGYNLRFNFSREAVKKHLKFELSKSEMKALVVWLSIVHQRRAKVNNRVSKQMLMETIDSEMPRLVRILKLFDSSSGDFNEGHSLIIETIDQLNAVFFQELQYSPKRSELDQFEKWIGKIRNLIVESPKVWIRYYNDWLKPPNGLDERIYGRTTMDLIWPTIFDELRQIEVNKDRIKELKAKSLNGRPSNAEMNRQLIEIFKRFEKRSKKLEYLQNRNAFHNFYTELKLGGRIPRRITCRILFWAVYTLFILCTENSLYKRISS